MGKDTNIIDDFAVLMDQNKRGVQYGIYSAAILGLTLALRSVRPFSKFTSPQSIPTSFIAKHIKLRGKVVAVEPSGLLKVDHAPIWYLPFQNGQPLSVQIASVQVMGHGTAWLQAVIKGETIHFLPVAVEHKSLSCIVIREKKNVGIQLVSLGFATVQPIHLHLDRDELYTQYYKSLLAAEDKAEGQRLGVWADGSQRPRTAIAVDIIKKMSGVFHTAIKKFIRQMSSGSAAAR